MNIEIISESPEQTIEIGRRVGEKLKGGEVVAVYGPLGSGKTHLIKGIAAGAGAEDSSRQVNSPITITIMCHISICKNIICCIKSIVEITNRKKL